MEIELEGKTVRLVETDLAGQMPAKRIEASIGQTTVVKTVTFGAVDGPRPELSLENLQAAVESARLSAAQEALWQERLHELLAAVD